MVSTELPLVSAVRLFLLLVCSSNSFGPGLDKNGYYHERFLRGKRFLAKRIQRTKVKGTGARKPSSPLSEPKFYQMPYLTGSAEEELGVADRAGSSRSHAAPTNSPDLASGLLAGFVSNCQQQTQHQQPILQQLLHPSHQTSAGQFAGVALPAYSAPPGVILPGHALLSVTAAPLQVSAAIPQQVVANQQQLILQQSVILLAQLSNTLSPTPQLQQPAIPTAPPLFIATAQQMSLVTPHTQQAASKASTESVAGTTTMGEV